MGSQRRGRDDPLPTLPSERARRRAAIIYTSGSTWCSIVSLRITLTLTLEYKTGTGRPKGVVMEHRNLLAITSWHNEFYKIRPGERTLHNAGLAFDACQQETWPTLIAGATIVMLTNREVQLTPHLLLDWLSKHRHDTACGSCAGARTCDRLSVTGGDKLHRGPTAGVSYKLYNGYGPCENTICTTQFCVHPTIPRNVLMYRRFPHHDQGLFITHFLSSLTFITHFHHSLNVRCTFWTRL